MATKVVDGQLSLAGMPDRDDYEKFNLDPRTVAIGRIGLRRSRAALARAAQRSSLAADAPAQPYGPRLAQEFIETGAVRLPEARRALQASIAQAATSETAVVATDDTAEAAPVEDVKPSTDLTQATDVSRTSEPPTVNT